MTSKRRDDSRQSRIASGPQITLLTLVCFVGVDAHTLAFESLGLPTFALGKAAPFMVTAWAPLMLVVVWYNSLLRLGDSFSYRLSPTIVSLAGVVVLLYILEVCHSILANGSADFEFVIEFWWVLFLLVAGLSFQGQRGVEPALAIALSVAVLCALFFVLVFAEDSPLRLGVLTFFRTENRPQVSGLNSFAFCVALMTVLAAEQARAASSQRERLWWLMIVAAGLLGLVGVRSRAAWFIMGVSGALLLGWLALRSRWAAPVLATGCLLLGVTCVALIWAFPDLLSLGRGLEFTLTIPKERTHSSEDLGRFALALRFEMIRLALSVFYEHPWMGVGLGRLSGFISGGHTIHGVPFRVAAAYGLAGVTILAIALWFILRETHRAKIDWVTVSGLAILSAILVTHQTPPIGVAVIVLSLVLRTGGEERTGR